MFYIPRYASYSMLAEAETCRWRFKRRYVDGLRPLQPFRPPTLGTAVHLGIATRLRGGDVENVLGEWVAAELDKVRNSTMLEQDADEAADMLLGAEMDACEIVNRWEEWVKLDEWETVHFLGEPLVEASFFIELPGWRGLHFIVDWVATHTPTGLTWVIDWKTKATIEQQDVSSINREDTNLQKAIYQYGLLQHGIKTAGSRIAQIKSAVPKHPKVNKDGSISRAAVSTDWPAYKAAIEAAGLDPEDYADMKIKYENSVWFAWTAAYRSERELNNIWEQVVVPRAHQAAALALSGMDAPRALGSFSCGMCWAKSLCVEELRGGDTEFIMKTQYRHVKKSDAEDPDEMFEYTPSDVTGNTDAY